MRWFTRDCLTSGLGDHEWQDRYDSYALHLSALLTASLAGSALNALADLSFHDGQPRWWSVDGEPFELRLLVGDLQRGYQWATLTYLEAELIPAGAVESFATWPLTECEIAADELDSAPNGRFEQRFLLWPQGEFGVRFSKCGISLTPAAPADRR